MSNLQNILYGKELASFFLGGGLFKGMVPEKILKLGDPEMSIPVQ